jgi:hypothetical protein
VQLQREVEVAAFLADQPRVAPQPPDQVPRNRLLVVDRKQRVEGFAHEPAARSSVHEASSAEGFSRESGIARLLVALEQDLSRRAHEIGSARKGSGESSPR